ncbi:unnamed protein product [Ectocarpus sp. 13 AM-2016]
MAMRQTSRTVRNPKARRRRRRRRRMQVMLPVLGIVAEAVLAGEMPAAPAVALVMMSGRDELPTGTKKEKRRRRRRRRRTQRREQAMPAAAEGPEQTTEGEGGRGRAAEPGAQLLPRDRRYCRSPPHRFPSRLLPVTPPSPRPPARGSAVSAAAAAAGSVPTTMPW